MAAYRIAQEALTNVARHARTSQATIHIAADAELLVIEIDDHGCGFDSEPSLTASSNGLLGMRERARLLNGRVTIDSTAGRGTRAIAELPIGTATRSASSLARPCSAEDRR